MSETWRAIFAFAGMVFVFVFVLGLLYAIYEWLKDRIRDARWEYKYKHRFDKPPTAKCWCKDCVNRDEDGECDVMGRFVPNDAFCCHAEPKEKDL